MAWYPKEVYSINETVTRENMRKYDLRQQRLYDLCLEIEPDYYKLDFKARREIRMQAEKEL